MSGDKVNKKDFKELFQKGKKIYRGYFVAYYGDYDRNIVKIGIKKKVGNSVKRNYHKRFMRNLVGLLDKQNNFIGNKLVLIVILREINFSFEEALNKFSNTFRTIYR